MKTVTIPENTVKTCSIDLNASERNLEFIVKREAKLTVLIIGKVVEPVDFRVNVRMDGRDASAKIIGCTAVAKEGFLTLNSLQHHAAPNTTSDLLVKSVLSDTSSFIYQGVIKVDKIAQRTDAYQKNENLLVSPGVYCDSKPILEILANDVKCTHGATTGPLSDEEMWYIRSRGIHPSAARSLLIAGFLGSAAAKLSDGKDAKLLKSRVWELL